jgi:DNA-binding beta-propeller fold protein YncE
VGSHPEAIALSPNQVFLLVVNTGSSDLTVLSLVDNKGRPQPDTPKLETMVPLGKAPRDIVVKAFVSQQ